MKLSWSAKMILAGAAAMMGDRMRKRLKIKAHKCPECGKNTGVETPVAIVCQTCGALFLG